MEPWLLIQCCREATFLYNKCLFREIKFKPIRFTKNEMIFQIPLEEVLRSSALSVLLSRLKQLHLHVLIDSHSRSSAESSTGPRDDAESEGSLIPLVDGCESLCLNHFNS